MDWARGGLHKIPAPSRRRDLNLSLKPATLPQLMEPGTSSHKMLHRLVSFESLRNVDIATLSAANLIFISSLWDITLKQAQGCTVYDDAPLVTLNMSDLTIFRHLAQCKGFRQA